MIFILFVLLNLLLLTSIIKEANLKSKTTKQDEQTILNKGKYLFSSKNKVKQLFRIFGPRPKENQRNDKYKGYPVWWFYFSTKLKNRKKD